MAIVLPDGIVTNANAQFGRTWVMSQARILGAVSLPLETFAPFGTQTKTSIVFLQKYSKEEIPNFDYPVFMANIENIGYDATGRTKESTDIKEILQAWNDFKKDPSNPLKVDHKRAYITTGEKIKFRWDFKAGAVNTDEGYVPIGKYLDVVKVTKNLQKNTTDVFPYLSISELPNDPFLVKNTDIQQIAGVRLQGPKMIAKKGDILFARLGPSMGNKKSLLVGDDIELLYCMSILKVNDHF